MLVISVADSLIQFLPTIVQLYPNFFRLRFNRYGSSTNARSNLMEKDNRRSTHDVTIFFLVIVHNEACGLAQLYSCVRDKGWIWWIRSILLDPWVIRGLHTTV